MKKGYEKSKENRENLLKEKNNLDIRINRSYPQKNFVFLSFGSFKKI
ncbi:MAG: hypothetical protein LIO87_08435 [Eubacterium sp.]|nr:hypothetical protein [Eubacterium sp.]